METKLLRAALYGILSISIAFSMSVTTIGQKDTPPPLPVRVTNTTDQAIPVSGTVNVASSPSTPVSVTGNVNVAGSVSVTNAANSTLLVRDLNSVAKTPIQLTGECTEPLFCTQVNYNVPAGKLLVIESVSTRVEAPEGTKGRVSIATCMNPNLSGCITGGPITPVIDRRAVHVLNPTEGVGSWSASTINAGTSEKVLIFANDRDPVTIWGQCSPALASPCRISVVASGYLIDNP